MSCIYCTFSFGIFSVREVYVHMRVLRIFIGQYLSSYFDDISRRYMTSFKFHDEAKFVMQTQKPQITYHSSTTLLISDHLTFSGELFPFVLSYF